MSSGASVFSSRPGTASSRPPSSSAAAAALSRPGTASSRPSTASSGGSGRSDPRSVVRSVHGQLNVWDIGAVKELLCRELQEERSALMEDIEYLQGLLEDETDLQVGAEVIISRCARQTSFSVLETLGGHCCLTSSSGHREALAHLDLI